MPATADAFAINVPDGIKALGVDAEALAADPVVKALREDFHAKGRTQGDFDNLFEALGVLESKGLVAKPIDFAAEQAALGENGAARRGEVETFARSLKERGEIDDGEFAELMSLAPMAKGVTLVEKLRKMTGTDKTIDASGGDGGGANADTADQKRAREMANDPKYGKDRTFTQEADSLYRKAFA